MFKKTVFDNGLKVITVPSKNTKSVTILVIVAAGSKYEEKRLNGISHFLEHMFFKGTKKRPNALKVAETLDKVGGIYNAFTSKEYTGYFAKVEATYFDLALDWVSDIFLNSKIEKKELEKEKAVIAEEINMYLDTPMQDVENVFEALLYGEQPAGRRVIGSKENIVNFRQADLVNYLKNHYSSFNTIICAAGNFQEKAAIEKIKAYFNPISRKTAALKIKVKECQKEPGISLQFKKTDQTHLCLGVRAFNLFEQRRYVQEVLSTILGGNMSSRLFMEIREKRGLAYYIQTASEFYTDSGYLMTQAGIPNNKVEEAVNLILKEYKKAAQQGVKAQELQKAKDYLRGALTLHLETPDAQASFYGAQELLTGKVITLQEKISRFNEVNLQAVKEAAGDIFRRDNLNLALIGPHQDSSRLQKLLDNF